MNRDCETFCWKEDHMVYLVVSLIVIFGYSISTLCYRSIPNSLNPTRNILVSPVFNFIKGLFQMSLVSLSVILKKEYSSAFNVAFSLIVLIYLLLSFKLRIYNYKRIKLI